MEEIDALYLALEAILAGRYAGKVVQDIRPGAFLPQDWHIDFDNYFSLACRQA
jgi:hypothetical protein